MLNHFLLLCLTATIILVASAEMNMEAHLLPRQTTPTMAPNWTTDTACSFSIMVREYCSRSSNTSNPSASVLIPTIRDSTGSELPFRVLERDFDPYLEPLSPLAAYNLTGVIDAYRIGLLWDREVGFLHTSFYIEGGGKPTMLFKTRWCEWSEGAEAPKDGEKEKRGCGYCDRMTGNDWAGGNELGNRSCMDGGTGRTRVMNCYFNCKR
ncbi:hypothetical protein BU24DRAFT_412916 [Aaosphaeria arxii CBS 175.79]|uniref:Uncharacterized protein n=1 Tax=Aaosphaeria arxii CBS 175.79 TaxID=1450172 RepID=A0A6A5XEG8_9PLEO|nr:uncharacterized protein BU24DRAFT_412916 [Aaosphaeria arxii CBS 175.79]KAF2011226.1 hypothetical protein BU24DRAFT_412916 [Aaosphaeria arxii CBS 175.79]